MCNNDGCKCIAEILTVIKVLQDNAECDDDRCLDTCDKGFLGDTPRCIEYNTRPVMLYTCAGNGTPWEMPTTKTDDTCGDPGVTCSNVFRVEKIDDCCCTFRVLVPNPECRDKHKERYIATDSFFTINLSCVCAIRCLKDTFVDCV